MSNTAPGITAEVLVSGCPLCEETLDLVNELAGPEDTVIRHDLSESPEALDRAEGLGISSVPSAPLQRSEEG